MKLKQIAAVVALAAASVPSFASIATPSTGNGELFVAIYDAADQASYTLDLGIFVNDFNGNSTYSYTLTSANWNAFVALAGTDNLQFAVIGGDTAGGTNTTNPRRLFTTVNSTTPTITGPQVNTAGANTNTFIGYTTSASANTTHTGAATVNGDSFDVVGNNAYFLTQNMNTFNGVTASAGWGNNVAAGTAATFMSFNQVNASAATATVNTTFAGAWTLSQQGSNWVVQYSAVPDADGLALMVAGFGAVGFLARRRKAV